MIAGRRGDDDFPMDLHPHPLEILPRSAPSPKAVKVHRTKGYSPVTTAKAERFCCARSTRLTVLSAGPFLIDSSHQVTASAISGGHSTATESREDEQREPGADCVRGRGRSTKGSSLGALVPLRKQGLLALIIDLAVVWHNDRAAITGLVGYAVLPSKRQRTRPFPTKSPNNV